MKDILIFLKHVFLKPIKEFLDLRKLFLKPSTWTGIFGLLFLARYFTNALPSNIDKFLIVMIVFTLIWKEYIKGDWKYEYREQQKKKMRKKLNEGWKEAKQKGKL